MSETAIQSTHPKPRAPLKTGRGQKPMVWLLGLALVAIAIINEAHATSVHGELWKVLVAILAFAYLWWLSSLLFDLVFVWHRYIRHDAAHKFLRAQVQRKDFTTKSDPPDRPPLGGGEPAVIPPATPSGGEPKKWPFPGDFTFPSTVAEKEHAHLGQ